MQYLPCQGVNRSINGKLPGALLDWTLVTSWEPSKVIPKQEACSTFNGMSALTASTSPTLSICLVTDSLPAPPPVPPPLSAVYKAWSGQLMLTLSFSLPVPSFCPISRYAEHSHSTHCNAHWA